MSGDKPIRHVVSIAGVVQEKNDQKPLRIADALVRIIVHQAPPEFQAMVSTMLDPVYANSFTIDASDFVTELDGGRLPEALREQFRAHGKPLSPEATSISVIPKEIGSTWQIIDAGTSYTIWHLATDRLTVYFNVRQLGLASRQPRQRIDQTRSQGDGVFTFVDLPPGDYLLRVSVPEMGSRYGTVETDPAHPVQVQPAPDVGPVTVAEINILLPPTRIHGTITQAGNGNPLPAARLHLLGDTTVVKTDADGRYELTRQLAGTPALKVTAPRFQPDTRRLALAAGDDCVADFALQPV